MSGTNLQDVQNFGLLQRQYSNDVIYQEHYANAAFAFVETDTSINYDGEAFFVPLSMVINTSYGARNDDEPLPVAEKSKGIYAQYSSKMMYSTIESTFKAATRGYRGGRPDGEWLDKLLRDTLVNCEHEISNDTYQNGRGQRAFISTATATQTNFTVVSSTQLLPGQKLDWWDAALTTFRGSIRIDDAGIDRQARTVYIDVAFGTGAVPSGAVAGDRLVIAGALDAGEPADGRFMGGLDRITDNTISIGGVAPSSWRSWQSYIEDMAGTVINIDVLQRLFDNMKTISGKNINRWILNPSQKRQYFHLLVAMNKFAPGDLMGGASKIGYSPVRMGTDMDGDSGYDAAAQKILEDAACPLDVMYFYNNEALKRGEDYTQGGPQLAEEDGRTFRFKQGPDALSAFLRYWANYCVFQRNAIGKIKNLAVPAGVI